MFTGVFPQTRLRRTRQHEWSRRLVSETSVQISDLIYPVFIRTPDTKPEISSMPGVRRYTLSELPALVEILSSHSIPAVCLFPVIPENLKTDMADECLNEDGLLPKAIREIKKLNPAIGVFSDAALDSFTSHGHDGLFFDGDVDNDRTLDLLARHSLLQARAGADMIAPSDMMDGRVGVIRDVLDREGFHKTGIVAYSAKYASAFYGPFREALQSAKSLGASTKKTYQMDPANGLEAMREIAQDIAEGADMVMIKPGMPYLDIVHQVHTTFKIPTLVYQVSGEYAMLKSAALAGFLDYNKALYETILCFKRAGASAVVTYAALDVAKMIRENYE